MSETNKRPPIGRGGDVMSEDELISAAAYRCRATAGGAGRNVTVMGTEGGYLLDCRRCGAEEYGDTPMPVAEFCAHLDRFMATHRECAA